MEPNRTVVLCPECVACPEIKVYGNKVTIGEEDNLVTLKIEEWNNIVEKIINGEIGKI